MYLIGSFKAEYQVKHIQQVKVKQFSMARTTFFVSNKNNNKNNNKSIENNDKKYARNKRTTNCDANWRSESPSRAVPEAHILYIVFFWVFLLI